MKKFIFSSAILMALSFVATAQNSIHITNGKSIIVQGRGTNSYQLPNEEIEIYFGEEEGLANIYRSENETKVVISVNVKYSGGWVFFSENTFLKDCETGDLYKVRRMKRSIPLAKTIYINDYTGMIKFTMVFPPLGTNVKRIDFIQRNSDHGARPMAGSNWHIKDIDLSQYPKKEPNVIL